MNDLDHAKLLQLAASYENPREMIMVMEYIGGGELFEKVVADDFTLTERVRANTFYIFYNFQGSNHNRQSSGETICSNVNMQ